MSANVARCLCCGRHIIGMPRHVDVVCGGCLVELFGWSLSPIDTHEAPEETS